jgi:hypothetical protein
MIPRWEILILTMPTRKIFLERLMKVLTPELEYWNRHCKVQVRIRTSDPKFSLGENRQLMREQSQAEYTNFLDDDDLVRENYLSQIAPKLDGVDYIGHEVAVYEDGVKKNPAYHSLKCGGWWSNDWGYYRDISHINPIKNKLALAAPMWGGFGEDSRWAGDLRALKLVRTEHYIDAALYTYLSRTDKTDGVTPGRVTAGVCPACTSRSTVLTNNGKQCNKCGSHFG